MRRLLVGTAWIVGGWWLLAALTGSRVVPAPPAVLLRLLELAPVSLWRHALASLLRAAAALALATAVALPLGLAMGRLRALDTLLSPASYLLYPIPKIALLPILLLLVGTGDLTRVVLVALVLFFQILLAVRDGARAVDEHYLVSIDSLGGSRADRIRYVVWPLVVPRLLTAMRVASGTALAVLFFAETFFTSVGLGFLIMDSWMKLAYVDMYVGIVGLSLLGLLLFASIDGLERRLTRWREGA